ncbi:hypothetical protein M9H77_18841 [Catharanthus roseus]|uniref:Uncharacterized protein n=1 Tax=Catharanthus roseus TaxID=4058 RepID=A0ACC0B8N8_CATRO|nr:hypothetical protein M9H77_18841 [Catharanthus roseus]
MQEHQELVTKAKAKQLNSHKDQIEQEKFQKLNFDIQDFMGKYAKVLNKLEIENSPWSMVGSPFARAGKLSPIFCNMSNQAQAPTSFGEESSNSQHDDPLRIIMQELQSLRDEMRDIRRNVTNLSNQQKEVSPHGSLNVTIPRSNGPFNFSRTTEFHQLPHFDKELHPLPYSGRRGSFGGRGMPRHFEEVPRPQTRHGEP